MSLINKLHDLVTPHVLAATKTHAGDNDKKSALLSSFYAIFAARLSDKASYDRLNGVDLDNGREILDAVFNDEGSVNQVARLNDELAKESGLSAATTTGALTAVSAPLVLSRIKELAGTSSVPAFLAGALAGFKSLVPSWATALLPAGLLAAGAAGVAGATTAATTATTTASTAGVATTAAPVAATAAAGTATSAAATGGFLKSLLPIIGLIILGGLAWLLLRSCQDKPAPVAAPAQDQTAQAASTESAAATNVAPATLMVAVDETGNQVYSCRGQVGSEGLVASVSTALAGVFGADKCDKLENDATAYAQTMPAAEHLSGILGLMKGVPSSSVSIDGKTVRFNAANADDIAKLVAGAKGILPADFTVEAEPALDISAAVNQSIDSAKQALSRLDADATADADDLVRALNLQIINFATNSSDIPQANQEILDLAAAKLASLPDASLKIIGHTDNQGNHGYNQKLSEQRASAVRDYLVAKGVPAERLQVLGASFDHPVASNATEQGRFQNRRIEFTLLQAGEQVAAVGNAPTSKATQVQAEQKAEQQAEQSAEQQTEQPAQK